MPERIFQCRVQSTHSRVERVNTRLAGSYKWLSREGSGCAELNWAMKHGPVANRTGKNPGRAGRGICCVPMGMELMLPRRSSKSCYPDKRSPGSLHHTSHRPLDAAAQGVWKSPPIFPMRQSSFHLLQYGPWQSGADTVLVK